MAGYLCESYECSEKPSPLLVRHVPVRCDQHHKPICKSGTARRRQQVGWMKINQPSFKTERVCFQHIHTKGVVAPDWVQLIL